MAPAPQPPEETAGETAGFQPNERTMNHTEQIEHAVSILLAVKEGKTIQRQPGGGKGDWFDMGFPFDMSWPLRELRQLRIKPDWKLPDPPEGEKWSGNWAEGELSDGERPLLVGEVMGAGDILYYVGGNTDTVSGWHGAKVDELRSKKCKTKRPLPGQEIAPGHNPAKLTVAQVGEGWRLLDDDEVKTREGAYPEIEGRSLSGDKWEATCSGCAPSVTYRTRLTREELAALDKPKCDHKSIQVTRGLIEKPGDTCEAKCAGCGLPVNIELKAWFLIKEGGK